MDGNLCLSTQPAKYNKKTKAQHKLSRNEGEVWILPIWGVDPLTGCGFRTIPATRTHERQNNPLYRDCKPDPLRSKDGRLPEQTHEIWVWICGYVYWELGIDWRENSDLVEKDPQWEWGEEFHKLEVEKSHTEVEEKTNQYISFGAFTSPSCEY